MFRISLGYSEIHLHVIFIIRVSIHTYVLWFISFVYDTVLMGKKKLFAIQNFEFFCL